MRPGRFLSSLLQVWRRVSGPKQKDVAGRSNGQEDRGAAPHSDSGAGRRGVGPWGAPLLLLHLLHVHQPTVPQDIGGPSEAVWSSELGSGCSLHSLSLGTKIHHNSYRAVNTPRHIHTIHSLRCEQHRTLSAPTHALFYTSCISLLIFCYMFRHNRHLQGAYTSVLRTYSNQKAVHWYISSERVLVTTVTCPVLQYLSTLSHKCTIFGGVIKHKIGIWFSIQLLCETFLILRTIRRDIITTRHTDMSWCNVLVILATFEGNLNFLDRFFKNVQIKNFLKIRPVEVELFYVDR